MYINKENIIEHAQLETALTNYINQSIAAFITGNMDIDKDWDEYIINLNKQGLARLLEITQETYDMVYKYNRASDK